MVSFCFPLRKLHKVHIINRFLIVSVVTGWYNYVCYSISFSPVTKTKSKNIWQPFQTHLQTRQVHSYLSIFLFCEEDLFCFNFFTGCFAFHFGYICLGLIWFLLVLVIFSWSCCGFLFQSELVMILIFSRLWFVR